MTAEAVQEKPGLRIQLKPYQHNFIYSKKRHPAAVMGWGTGKTLCGISRARIYSKLIPNNMGVIFRKTAKSLSDSTLRDFERYTKLKVDSQRNLIEPNGSITMFRHIDEIGDINQQNINLGWYMIEQGEELDSDKEFFMLFGRLRRAVTPTPEFMQLGLPIRSGWVIANATDGWMFPLWKQGKLEAVAKELELSVEGEDGQGMTELIEATTFDNEENLPKDFVASLKILEKTKPEIFKRFVLNDWSIAADRFTIVTREQLELLKIVTHDYFTSKRVISIDPSEGGDACVILAMENNSIVKKQRLFVNDTMKIVGEALIMATEFKTKNFTGDAIGNGKGVFDRLAEMGYNVLPIKSSEASSDPEQWFNMRSEIWGHFQKLVHSRELPPINDPEVEKQVLAIRYDPKAVNSRGRIKIVPKDETKKILGHSPDDADAFIYGLWAIRQIEGEAEAVNFKLKTRHMMGGGAGGW